MRRRNQQGRSGDGVGTEFYKAGRTRFTKGNRIDRLQAKGNGKGIYGLYMGEADISNDNA